MLHLLPSLDHPAALLAAELDHVQLVFERQLASDLSAVNRLCLHVERYRGKMVRPALVLLSGMAASPAGGARAGLSERHRVLAAVTEMIHMATLVHDDVLDEAEVRRGGATVNRLWGNETAVMLGDYLISNAFHLCSTMGEPSINLALGEVTNTLCEGELMQLHHRDDYAIDEATYYEIVRRKTASLIGACCRLGGLLAGAEAPVAAALQRYGLDVGIAFQLRDDLLDLIGEQSTVGKSLGRDLETGKLTLPIIHHLAQAAPAERGRMLRLLEQRDADGVRRCLIDSGSVEYTQRAAADLAARARSALGALPASPARTMLEEAAETTVARER